MPDRLRPWLVISLSIGLLQLAFSPWGFRHLSDLNLGYGGQPMEVSDGQVYGIWNLLMVGWLVVVVAGLRKLGRRGGWLLLSAPLALLPLEFVILIVIVCIFGSTCL